MMRATHALGAMLVLGGTLASQAEVHFEQDVLPFLQAKCFKCHGKPETLSSGKRKEPKGGLRLDGRGWFERGGDGEDAVVAGDLEESGVYRRVTLPADDPDFMPSKGDPLTAAEVETLRRWIEQGADFGDWRGTPGPGAGAASRPTVVAATPPRIQHLRRIGQGLATISSARLDKIAGDSAQIQAAIPDSPLLRVSFRAAETRTDDKRLRELTPLGAHITRLELGRTKVTDRGMAVVAKMPRLTHLSLSNTEVGDAGLQQLKKLDELRVLNLYGTRVTDASLPTLNALPALERVFVWQSGISAGGVDELRKARPTLEVVGAPVWPEPPEPETDARPRRRR